MSEGPDEVISALEQRGGETLHRAASVASELTISAAARRAPAGGPAAAQAAATAAQGLPLDPRSQLAASRRGQRSARDVPVPRPGRAAGRGPAEPGR